MNIRKIYLFVTVLIGYLVTSPYYLYGSSVFQTMATSINQQLFPIAQQTIVQPSDPHMQQLIRSVFAQLQNTTQTKDIGSVIDVILNSLQQRQEYSQDTGVSLVIVTVAHSLRIIAQKLYRSISFIRRSLLYWKKIDQQSLFHYCITHIPTIWGAKFKGGFPIKQKIAQAEKLYALYVSQLGLVSRLIHQLPQTTNGAINITWITNALMVFKKYSQTKNATVPTTKPFSTTILLKHIKLFLSNFDQDYNNQFQPIKDCVGLPSYFSHSFGKIVAYTAMVGGAFFSAYYYANEIGNWSKYIFNEIEKHVWSPIYKNIKAIFSPQEKDLLMDEKKLKLIIENSNELEKECLENLNNIAPKDTEAEELRKLILKQFSDKPIRDDLIKCLEKLNDFVPKHEEDKKLKEDILEYFSKFPISDVDSIIKKNDYKELLFQLMKLKDKRWTVWGSGSDSVNVLPIIITLLSRQLVPTAYKSQANLAGIVLELAKALLRLDADLLLLRKLFILTPALFTVAGTYKAGSAMYDYATHKDYTNLKIAFKELETVTICAVNQPENDSSYGLFIFLLETLKIGVVQMLPSRYTERNELLEDLTRLESPDLTFKQRLRLIEQIRRSYSIFKQS